MKRLTRVVAALASHCVWLGAFCCSGESRDDGSKVKKAPAIDGKLSDAAWLEAASKGSKTVVDLDNNGIMLTESSHCLHLLRRHGSLHRFQDFRRT